MITLDEAKSLKYRDVLIVNGKRWRVNGKPRTWKRSPDRVEVPVKYGLYTYDTLTQDFLSIVSLESK